MNQPPWLPPPQALLRQVTPDQVHSKCRFLSLLVWAAVQRQACPAALPLHRLLALFQQRMNITAFTGYHITLMGEDSSACRVLPLLLLFLSILWVGSIKITLCLAPTVTSAYYCILVQL